MKIKVIYLLLSIVLFAGIVPGQDIGVRWDQLPANDRAKTALRHTVERSYFKVLDRNRLGRPTLLVVHCYTSGMSVQGTNVVVGSAQDEIWLAGNDVRQLEREIAILVFLHKQLRKEGGLQK